MTVKLQELAIKSELKVAMRYKNILHLISLLTGDVNSIN